MKVLQLATVDVTLKCLLLPQVEYLLSLGFEVTMAASRGRWTAELRAQGFRVYNIPISRRISPVSDLLSLVRLYRFIKKEGFQIVHTHNPKPGFVGQIAAKMAGVPIIVNTLHGFYFHDHMDPMLRRFYITLEKVAARCSDVILSQNREDIVTAIREGIAAPEKIKHLSNGIDVRRFNPATLSPKDIARKRTEVDLPVEALVVGFVGRLVQEKGLLELFAAARLVREEVQGVRFLVIGPVDTHKRDALTPDRAGEYGIADICHFLGWRDDMPELYALMDVFVLPSHREGFPRTPMEASAMKVPCVVTDIRGCREAVEHGHNGLLVPLGDVQALADAIIELLTDKERARRIGEEGRRIALGRFDEQLVFEKVKTEYVGQLREKGLPVPSPCGAAIPERTNA